jgi:hypothetical protein
MSQSGPLSLSELIPLGPFTHDHGSPMRPRAEVTPLSRRPEKVKIQRLRLLNRTTEREWRTVVGVVPWFGS